MGRNAGPASPGGARLSDSWTASVQRNSLHGVECAPAGQRHGAACSRFRAHAKGKRFPIPRRLYRVGRGHVNDGLDTAAAGPCLRTPDMTSNCAPAPRRRSTNAWPGSTATSRPGGAGGRMWPSAPGARSARTTAPTAMPGTSSRTISPAARPTAGARMGWPGSATATRSWSSPWRSGTSATRS